MSSHEKLPGSLIFPEGCYRRIAGCVVGWLDIIRTVVGFVIAANKVVDAFFRGIFKSYFY